MTFKLDKPLSTSSTHSLVLDVAAVPPLISASSKQISYRGVLCEFITEPPQKFICSICTQLVKDPHLTACCGHEFCEGCLTQWENKSMTYSCPHCRQSEFVHILDKQTRREIEELKVYCPKHSHGCTWEGELGLMKCHEKDCSFTPIKCPHCSINVPQKDLLKHSSSECPFRDSRCSYCGKEDAYFKVISFVHMAECPGYPMDCPNKCGMNGIKRSNILEHRKSCSLEEIECPLKMAGCSEKMLRKDLQVHVNSSQGEHLLKLMVAFEKSRKEIQDQRQELRELKMFEVTTTAAMTRISSSMDQLLEKSLTTELAPLRSIRALVGPGALILNSEHREISLVLPNYSQFEKKKSTMWESLPFYLESGYKACLVFLLGIGKLNDFGAEIRLLPGEFDGELLWPCDISFNKICLSLKTDGADIDITPPPPSKREQPPFCLSMRGTRYSSVAPCGSTESNHVLWRTKRFMDALPPYPSAIRARYLHHDCLTVKLTWVESQQTTPFITTSLQCSLPEVTPGPKGDELSTYASIPTTGSQLHSGSVVSVFTSGVGQHKARRRRKS